MGSPTGFRHGVWHHHPQAVQVNCWNGWESVSSPFQWQLEWKIVLGLQNVCRIRIQRAHFDFHHFFFFFASCCIDGCDTKSLLRRTLVFFCLRASETGARGQPGQSVLPVNGAIWSSFRAGCLPQQRPWDKLIQLTSSRQTIVGLKMAPNSFLTSPAQDVCTCVLLPSCSCLIWNKVFPTAISILLPKCSIVCPSRFLSWRSSLTIISFSSLLPSSTCQLKAASIRMLLTTLSELLLHLWTVNTHNNKRGNPQFQSSLNVTHFAPLRHSTAALWVNSADDCRAATDLIWKGFD